MFLRMISPFFTVGLIEENGRIIMAAPIIKYVTGWTLEELFAYCKERNWAIEEVKHGQDGEEHNNTNP